MKTYEGEFCICDWAGNQMFSDRRFDSFDDAEEFLSEFLGESYDTYRQEFDIQQTIESVRDWGC